MPAAKGFTLIEIIITVLIVSILTAIALPTYNNYVLRARLIEATNALSESRVRMEQSFQDNRRYATVAGGAVCPASVTATSVRFFGLACAVTAAADGSPEAYTITATGITGSTTAAFTYTINSANVRATTSTKWEGVTSTSCWISDKSGSCF